MADVLAQIVAHKITEVASTKARISPAEMARRADAAPPARDFFAAVTEPVGALRVIAEVKKASPSAGLIRADFDPVAIARAYHAGGAAAISCLTDTKYFQGELSYIDAIRRAVPIPVLRKDFVIDRYQVDEARAAGADAILLIAECLDDARFAELFAAVRARGMTCLVEVHDAENLARVQPVIRGQRALLGINNRNLKTMVTDLNHTLQLLPAVERRDALVSESGIRTTGDVARLRQAGIHRILVGEHLMRQPDVGAALRALMTPG